MNQPQIIQGTTTTTLDSTTHISLATTNQPQIIQGTTTTTLDSTTHISLATMNQPQILCGTIATLDSTTRFSDPVSSINRGGRQG
jgi:hypothetical protein